MQRYLWFLLWVIFIILICNSTLKFQLVLLIVTFLASHAVCFFLFIQEDRMLNGAKQAATKKLKMLPSVLTHLHKWVWLLPCSVCLPYSKYLSLIVLLTCLLSDYLLFGISELIYKLHSSSLAFCLFWRLVSSFIQMCYFSFTLKRRNFLSEIENLAAEQKVGSFDRSWILS